MIMTRMRSTRRCTLFVMLILSACTTAPSAEQLRPSPAPPTAAPLRTIAPTSAPEATLAPEATITATLPQPRSITLSPIRPLQQEAIVDRPARNMRALTDGATKYRLALWGPGSAWIAAVPQDGPGMDVINSVTGEVVPVITDTYVLEPVWDQAFIPKAETSVYNDSLLIHRVVDGSDQLDTYSIAARKFIRPSVYSATPIRAPQLGGNFVVYSSNGSVVRQSLTADQAAPYTIATGDALVTALSFGANGPTDSLLAWTPFVVNLETVQTVITPVDPRMSGAVVISGAGEGLWQPRWAGDGRKLVLNSIEGRLVTINVDGVLGKDRLDERYDLGPGGDPAWSPDSARIAFAGQSAGGEYTTRDIFVVDWQGNGPRLRLTAANDEQIFSSPSWSPDGTRIAFVEIDSGQIFVADAP